MERPGAIVSNHVSYVDILYHMSASFPSFVAKVLQTVRDMASVYMIYHFFHQDILILTCLFCTFYP
jgi:1-acyl-sn-glycerol-3-phosphate acyltransferase